MHQNFNTYKNVRSETCFVLPYQMFGMELRFSALIIICPAFARFREIRLDSSIFVVALVTISSESRKSGLTIDLTIFFSASASIFASAAGRIIFFCLGRSLLIPLPRFGVVLVIVISIGDLEFDSELQGLLL